MTFSRRVLIAVMAVLTAVASTADLVSDGFDLWSAATLGLAVLLVIAVVNDPDRN